MMSEKNRILEEDMALVSGGTTAAEGEVKFMIGDFVWFEDCDGKYVEGYVVGYNPGTKFYQVREDSGRLRVVVEADMSLVTVSGDNGASGGW